MPASSQISDTSDVDTSAIKTTCSIESKYSGYKSYCEQMTLQYGTSPSFAQVVIPLDALESKVPAITGVTSSPIESIKHGDIATVTATKNGSTLTLLSGTVRHISRSIKLDKATIIIKDHRFLLDGLSLVGSFWANIQVRGDEAPVAYRQGVKMHVNPNNQPNCLFVLVDADEGQTYKPMFCTPFLGHQDFTTEQSGNFPQTNAIESTIPQPGTEESRVTACYWTPATLWEHLQWATSDSARDLVASTQHFFEFNSLSSATAGWVIWPPNLENTLTQTVAESSKAYETVIHCSFLLPQLQRICEAAGPFTINMDSKTDGSNQLNILRTRYIDTNSSGDATSNLQGTTLFRAINGNAGDDADDAVVNDGHISESSENLYHVTEAVGGHAFIECRCVSPRFDGTIEDGYVPFSFAWASADMDSAQSAIQTNYTQKQQNDAEGFAVFGGLPKDFLPAIFKSFDVCASYQVQPGFDYQVGTNQAGFPMATVTHIPLGTLLSSYVQSYASDEFARQNSRFEIVVETTPNDDNTGWREVKNHGLSITGDGTLSFTQHRDTEAAQGVEDAAFYRILKTYGTSDSGPILLTAQLVPKRVRITLALPCDHRLTAAVALSGVSEITTGEIDTDDSNRINFDNGIRTLAIDTGTLLASEERSIEFPPYPIPQSLFQANGSPYPSPSDGTSDSEALFGNATVLRDDSNYAYNQANKKLREFGRLDRSSELITDRIDFSAQPGELVDKIQNTDGSDFPIKAVTEKVIHDFGGTGGNQSTKRQLV